MEIGSVQAGGSAAAPEATERSTRVELSPQQTQAPKGESTPQPEPAIRDVSPQERGLPQLPTPNQIALQVEQGQRVIFKLLEGITGRLLRQVPPEELVRISKQITELLESHEQQEPTVDLES